MPWLHAIVGRPPTLRGYPVDVLGGALDVTGLAVDAVLSVDLQPHPLPPILPGYKFVNPCWTKSLLGPVEKVQVSLHGNGVVRQGEVGRLVVVVVGT